MSSASPHDCFDMTTVLISTTPSETNHMVTGTVEFLITRPAVDYSRQRSDRTVARENYPTVLRLSSNGLAEILMSTFTYLKCVNKDPANMSYYRRVPRHLDPRSPATIQIRAHPGELPKPPPRMSALLTTC